MSFRAADDIYIYILFSARLVYHRKAFPIFVTLYCSLYSNYYAT